LNFAGRVIEVFRNNVGRRKGEMMEKLRTLEDEGFDYRFVRGLFALLERRSVFKSDAPIDPAEARMMVFQKASDVRVVDVEQRGRVIQEVSAKLGIHAEALEKVLYSDVEEELILKDFSPISPDALLKSYNLSITQTMLFRSLKLEFTVSGNWKSIFRSIKWLGLMYAVEREDDSYKVTVDGPLSLFKMTDRYGTALAKLLLTVIESGYWRIKADVLGRNKDRIYTFKLTSDEMKGLIESTGSEDTPSKQTYDSSVEERFAKTFNAYGSGWVLEREPEPLPVGRHVLIPDFRFTKYNMKVYLEIVGFWTPDYLERKIAKLETVEDVDLIVAVNEKYACSRLRDLKIQVVYYKDDVSIKPIIEHLKEREKGVIENESHASKLRDIKLAGDIVKIEDIAGGNSISVESARKVLSTLTFEGYKRVGDYFISDSVLKKIETSLMGIEKLSEALEAVEANNIKEPYQVIEALGYSITWNGLDIEKSRIRKDVDVQSQSH